MCSLNAVHTHFKHAKLYSNSFWCTIAFVQTCAWLQDIRSTQDPANIADKATLKRHVVRAINNLAGKDVKGKADGNAAIDAQSCAQQSEGAASTFFR